MAENVFEQPNNGYRRNSKPKELGKYNARRADKLSFAALGAGYALVAEHVLNPSDITPSHIAVVWVNRTTNKSAYLSLALKHDTNGNVAMKVVGVSDTQWLLNILQTTSLDEAVGKHSPLGCTVVVDSPDLIPLGTLAMVKGDYA